MRNLAMLVLVLAVQAAAQTRAVVSNCCTNPTTLSVLNATSGALEHLAVTGSQTANRTAGLDFAISRDNAAAFVLTGLYTTTQAVPAVLASVSLSTGLVTNSLSVPANTGAVAVNPQTGTVYITYPDSTGAEHIQELNPNTLAVLRDINLGAVGGAIAISVAPNGQWLYLFDGYITVVRAADLKSVAILPFQGRNPPVISPDGATLYLEALSVGFSYAVDIIDTKTRTITQTVPLPSSEQFSGALALSASGSQLYLGTDNGVSGALCSLSLTTLTTTCLASPPVDGLAVSPNGGTVFIATGVAGGRSQSETGIYLFDVATQTVINDFPVLGPSKILITSNGSQICALQTADGSLVATGPVPSTTVGSTVPSGYGSSAGTYDAKDNLLLAGDSSGHVNVLDGQTLALKGLIPVRGITSGIAVLEGVGFAVVGPPTADTALVRFDPVSLKVTGSVPIQNQYSNNFGRFIPAVGSSSSTLYLAIDFEPSGGGPALFDGVAVVNPATLTIETIFPVALNSYIDGFAVSPDGKTGYLGGGAGLLDDGVLKIDLATGTALNYIPLTPGSGTYGPSISPDGSTLYVADDANLYAIAASNLKIVNSVPAFGLTNLALTPDGNYLYAYINGVVPGVAIIDTATLATVGTIPTISFLTQVSFTGQ